MMNVKHEPIPAGGPGPAITDQEVIAGLARAKATFQLRAIATAIGLRATAEPPLVPPDCRMCWDHGVVSRVTPAPWSTPYRGRPLRGRYLDPCPAVGCKARVREFGA